MNKVIREHVYHSGAKLQIAHGDLTQESVDAIVNAANTHLQHGGGLAAAIVRRGGASIQSESSAWVREHGPVSHAEPAYTRAGSLPCRYVIHAVGPVWGEGGEDDKLAAAVTGSLKLAAQLGLASIAFPAISTGIFGYPKARAAQVILTTMNAYLEGSPTSVKVVRLTLFDQPTLEAFLQVWEEQGLDQETPAD